jgi:hypothetical protein
MATGIQGPQGYKGVRGLQGATGWGAIGSETGPTGPTGPMGMFSLEDNASSSLTLSMSTVSTLYRLNLSSLSLTNGGSMSAGGYWVFTNQIEPACDISLSGMTINDSASTYTVPPKGSVTLVFASGINFITL